MTKLMVSSPAELISAVPFLVGFHPADSLVVVAMRGPRITFTVRADLPQPGTPEDEARAAVLHLATVVLEERAEAVTIIGYGEEARATPAVLRISDAFRKARVTVVDELRVNDGRYWSYLCEDISCCPTEGHPCEPAFSVVATEATFAGAVALPSRESLAAQLASVTGDEREAMTAATARAMLRLAAIAAGSAEPRTETADQASPSTSCQVTAANPLGPAELRPGNVTWASVGIAGPGSEEPAPPADLLADEDAFFASVHSRGRKAVQEAERVYNTGGRLSDDDVAWLGVLLLNMPIRDYAWTRTQTREWELALWSDVMRRVEPRYLPAPASLFSFVAWRMGLGPQASVAMESALQQDPDYPLANLMQAVLTTGMPPSVLAGWPAVQGRSPIDLIPEPRTPASTPEPAPASELPPAPEPDLSSEPAAAPKPAPTPQPAASPQEQDSTEKSAGLPQRVRSERDTPGKAPASREDRPHRTRRASQRRV